MLRRLNPGVFGLVLMSVTLAGHGVEPFRCLKDGKVIITDVSCAALGGAIDTTPQVYQSITPKSQAAALPPTALPNAQGALVPPKATPPNSLRNPVAATPQKQPVNSGASVAKGFLQWGVLLVVIAFLVRFLQKLATKDVQNPLRPGRRLRLVEPRFSDHDEGAASRSGVSDELDHLLLAAKQKRDVPLPYKQAPLMSRYELELFQRLRVALPECEVFPQVPLAAFIRIDKRKAGKDFFQNSYSWQNRIGQQRLDYLVCLRDGMTIVAAVELDDPSHDNAEAEARDQKKDKSLRDAGVPLVRWRVESMPSVEQIRVQFDGTGTTTAQSSESVPIGRISPEIVPEVVQATAVANGSN